MGLSRRARPSASRIPKRSDRRLSSPSMKVFPASPSRHHRSLSSSSPPPLGKTSTTRSSGTIGVEGHHFKQTFAGGVQPSESAYMPPRGSNRPQHQQSFFENDFGPFSAVHQPKRHFNMGNDGVKNDSEDISSMFQRSEYESPINRSERLAGSYRVLEAARGTSPPIKVKVNKGYGKTYWDNGFTTNNADNEDNATHQHSSTNQPVINADDNGTSRRSLNKNDGLERILAKYGKPSKSSGNTERDPDFIPVVRTDTTTFRVNSNQFNKPGINLGPGIHSFWDSPLNHQQHPQPGDFDLISKLNNAAAQRRPLSPENLHEQLRAERTVQLPGPSGPVLAPMHPMENDTNTMPSCQQQQRQPGEFRQARSQSPVSLRRSTHVFPFKETPSGHLVIDPIQIAFESRKISVLVSDPNNNTATVELTTTKCGANGLLFQPQGNLPFLNKNERILHEVKRAMSIQETNENNAAGRSNPKLSHHQQPQELNQKRYSESKKATEEFEEKILNKIVSGKNADTHVVIGDKIYPCHSLALEVFSTYFERLTRPPETIQRIQLPESEVSAQAFPILMDWVVQSEDARRAIIKKENLISVYAAAKHLNMRDLEMQCITFLERKVDSSDPDLLSMWEDVKKRYASCPELVRIIAGKMAASYQEIYKSKRFLQMDIDELFMLLNSDDISIESEMDVYDSAVTWLLQDWKNRKVHTNKIMSTVRFGLLTPLQLTQINLCPELNKVKMEKDYHQILAYGTVKSMIDDGLAFSILDESYKNQPEELKNWVDKTGVKAPSHRMCLLSKGRGKPLIKEKISLLENASQTKLRAQFNKIPERTSSSTLLDTADPTNQEESAHNLVSGDTPISRSRERARSSTSRDQRGMSRIPKPPYNGGESGNCNQTSDKGCSNGVSPMVVQELSKPKLMSNSSGLLQQTGSETERESHVDSFSPDAYPVRDRFDKNHRSNK